MSESDPQVLYMFLVLPGLFGITMLGDGIYKLVHNKRGGLVAFCFGVMFVSIVVFGFVFLSLYLGSKT